jgi:N-acetylglucosamine kinase-like BadF-type ATPase
MHFDDRTTMADLVPEDDGLILGIDGGGTKTVALLAKRNTPDVILGEGVSGPSNQRAVGPRMAMNHLDLAVQAAFDQAGVERHTVEAACLGLAGADRQSDRSVVEDWAQGTRLAFKVQVVNDAMPLLHVGNAPGYGIALIAGTGSLAWGCNAQNRIARSGGWGYLFGDEGSAYALGRSILLAVTWSYDGRGPDTCLVNEVAQALKIESAAEIITAVYSNEIPRAVIAGLAPLVFDAADRMDIVSCDILNGAAVELAAMVVSLARRLDLVDGVVLSLTGSVLLQQAKFRTMVLDAVASRGIRVGSAVLVEVAARGALKMASALAVR